MRVALDARLTRQMSVGMKTYARELLARLPEVAPDLEFVSISEGANFGWTEQVRLPRAIRRARVGLTHFLSLYAPAFAPRPYVITVHDLIHLRFPQYFKAKVRPYYQTAVRFICSRAERVITDDVRTVGDLERYLGVKPHRVRVVPLGVEERFLAPIVAHRGERPYVLYVGNHRPHKDLETLLSAWQGLPDDLAVDLYVTGSDDFAARGGRQGRRAQRLVALGDVSDSQLPGYYAGAVALAHPALSEGFGLPLLEAMAARCPVVVCADAVPAELRACALTFPARDAAALRAQLLRLLGDEGLARSLVNSGRALAERLTWERCARETAAVYREVLEELTR